MGIETNITNLVTDVHKKARDDMIEDIVSDPYIVRYDFKKCSCLLADFLRLDFG